MSGSLLAFPSRKVFDYLGGECYQGQQESKEGETSVFRVNVFDFSFCNTVVGL